MNSTYDKSTALYPITAIRSGEPVNLTWHHVHSTLCAQPARPLQLHVCIVHMHTKPSQRQTFVPEVIDFSETGEMAAASNCDYTPTVIVGHGLDNNTPLQRRTHTTQSHCLFRTLILCGFHGRSDAIREPHQPVAGHVEIRYRRI